ncbi:MAG: TIGR03087 family PEP-CTERM/XrtA system glycosyltransferase [Casimicrobiaceae bacterium]
MKILCVTHRFPYPPDSGSKIRAFNMIRHLHAEHAVTVASIVRSDQEQMEGRGLDAWCSRYEMARVRTAVQVARMIASVPTPGTASSAYFHSADLARRIRRALAAESFDLVLVHSSSVAHYVAHVEGIPKILDFCDMDSQKWLEYSSFKPFPVSLGYRLEGVKLVAEEKRLARQFTVCTTATRAELETLVRYRTGTTADWFPNGVDTSYFSPGEEPCDPDLIGFVGRMDYYPNEKCVLEFCRAAFPLIRERRPGAKFVIIGAEPTAAVRRLGKLPGVTVTGSVPDVRPWLRRSAAMIAPLEIARGTQNKILEAMASGVPVVTSSAAAGGVDAVPGVHFLVADSAAEIATATLELMGSAQRRDEFARAGRARVLSHHAWDTSMRRLDRIIERAMELGAKGRGSVATPVRAGPAAGFRAASAAHDTDDGWEGRARAMRGRDA